MIAGLLSDNIHSGATPPSSPSRILKENENQWLNSEVADFSLSSFLGHLESPMKPSQSTSGISEEESRMSMDVCHVKYLNIYVVCSTIVLFLMTKFKNGKFCYSANN